MQIKNISAKDLKKSVRKIFNKYIDLKDYDVFFFGSRVAGSHRETSDIDIGIRGRKKVPRSAIFKIKEEIDNLPILYKIDIVDFSSVSKEFKRVAEEKIEMLNANER